MIDFYNKNDYDNYIAVHIDSHEACRLHALQQEAFVSALGLKA